MSSGVRIKISAIQRLTEGTYIATMEIGDRRVTTELEQQFLNGEFIGFNFLEETLFATVLYRCGFDKRFNDDFGHYLADGDYDLPWDYGDVEHAKITEAVEMHSARVAKDNHDPRSDHARNK